MAEANWDSETSKFNVGSQFSQPVAHNLVSDRSSMNQNVLRANSVSGSNEGDPFGEHFDSEQEEDNNLSS